MASHRNINSPSGTKTRTLLPIVTQIALASPETWVNVGHMELNEPGLENSRVKLERFGETHREPLRETTAVEYMWQSMPAIQRGAGFDAYFDHALRQTECGEMVAFAILDPTDHDRFVGVTAFLEPRRIHRRVKLGYTWIAPHLRGKGVYAAVQSLLIQRALDWGARRLSWHIEASNERAVRAIEALGAVKEGVLRQRLRYSDGEWADIVVLSMLREEAKEAVRNLNARLAELDA
ncbi:MAG: GNAT family protein [Henriciella sp.]|nr:GNAT family protein [Henriciella sp.]